MYAFMTDSFTCVPGQNYKDECNYCICAKSGKSGICTRMQCDSVYYNSDEHNQVEETFDVKREYL